MQATKTINEVLQPSKELKEGIGILAREEWLKLQAFTNAAIFKNPATDEMMRKALNLTGDAVLEPEFTETVNLYAKLKSSCSDFDIDIKPGTIKLAGDIVQYERTVAITYGHLIHLISEYSIDKKISPEKLKKLETEWKKENPSPEAEDIKARFKKYIENLKTEAEYRGQKAKELQAKLISFQTSLNKSKNDFDQNFEKYKGKYETVDHELRQLEKEIGDLEVELRVARKKRDDETLVLETAPLYLLIPGAGIVVMAGVLIGVGVDYGLLLESLKGKESKMQEFLKKCGTKQKFFQMIKIAKKLTDDTARDLTNILPLVEKLRKAWDALTSDLADISNHLLSNALEKTAVENWDIASLNLEVARKTWADLKEQAERYRLFTEVKPVDSVPQLSMGMIYRVRDEV